MCKKHTISIYKRAYQLNSDKKHLRNFRFLIVNIFSRLSLLIPNLVPT